MKTLALFLLTALSTPASVGVARYTSRAAFLKAIAGFPETVRFDLFFSADPSAQIEKVGFYNDDSVVFANTDSSTMYVIHPSYCCPTYNRGADQLSSGTGTLKITLPADITAIGFDLFGVQEGNLNGTDQDVVDVNIGGVNYSIATPPAPNSTFVGFVFIGGVPSLTIKARQVPNKPAVYFNLMNIVFGTGAPAVIPFGQVDTPVKNTTGVTGAINVTGWAISSATVQTVGIWRDPVAGEGPDLVFLSNATQVPGARPDVRNTYPTYPHSNYGWGAQILTNELPGISGQPIGNGGYGLHVIATDSQGTSVDVGGAISISANNASAVLPFGTIDTPAQGDTVSGSAYVNFGWAVTPNPAYVIPKDGSNITVYIDNVPVGHPTYNNFRTDIASLFPGLQNSNGAVGFYYLNSTHLTNGLHTIAWVVVDVGHAQGIGSRFFNVQN